MEDKNVIFWGLNFEDCVYEPCCCKIKQTYKLDYKSKTSQTKEKRNKIEVILNFTRKTLIYWTLITACPCPTLQIFWNIIFTIVSVK